ncbi:MAG: vanA [Gammaproteobacteria bacterium]|jgi:hypothetical protein|nr:vanA [Gammaproteobacteria bacterium]
MVLSARVNGDSPERTPVLAEFENAVRQCQSLQHLRCSSSGGPVDEFGERSARHRCAAGNRVDAAQFFGCQAVTPETENTSHYFFQQSHGFALNDPSVTENLRQASSISPRRAHVGDAHGHRACEFSCLVEKAIPGDQGAPGQRRR